MTYLTFDDIKLDIGAFLRRVQAGETLVLTEADQPIAEVKPVPVKSKERRPSGLCKGDFVVPDDFTDPLPEELLAAFEGR